MPVLSFALRKKTDWTNVERAEFMRIHKLLSSFGLHVAMEMGLSDENDPWCVFDLIETGETLVHFARIDGALIAHDIITDEIVKAASLTELAELIMAKYPSIRAGQGPKASDNVIAFPGAYLTGFVAAVYFFSQHTGRAQASDETNAFSSFVSEQIETMRAEKDDDKQKRDLAREHNLDGLDGLQQARNQSDNSQLAFSQFTKVLSGSVAAALLIFSGFEAVD
ncbi:MAG: hypothetical protein OIF54_06050, partial [Cohaesibacter sp.]|nr:hypothetical protein [Cohaesibacter sp.]